MDGRFFSRVGSRKKVAGLPILLSSLLLVTVLSCPLLASTEEVSLHFDSSGFAQVDLAQVAGVTMSGQTLSLDFFFPNPIEVTKGSLSAELFLQTALPVSTSGDYPYTQYVVFGGGSTATLIGENGELLNVSMSDWQGGVTSSPAATLGSVSTDRGWAGADMLAFPPMDQKIAGIRFDLVLPDTGQRIALGRLGVTVDGEILTQISQGETFDNQNTVESPTFESPASESPTSESPTFESPTSASPTSESSTSESSTPSSPASESSAPSAPTSESSTPSAPTSESSTSESSAFSNNLFGEPSVTDQTASTAVIHWQTDSLYSFVQYGTTEFYQDTVLPSAIFNEYSAALSGLSDNTTYHFRIVSFDRDWNAIATSDQTFSTPPLE